MLVYICIIELFPYQNQQIYTTDVMSALSRIFIAFFMYRECIYALSVGLVS